MSRKALSLWLVVFALLAVTGIALAAGAGPVDPLGHSDDAEHKAEEAFNAKHAPKPGTVAFDDAPVKDPDGKAPWVVRSYRNEAGDICTDAGQLRNGKFGEDRPGGIEEAPSERPGSRPDLSQYPAGCDALETEPFGVVIRRRADVLRGDGGRTIVFGQVKLGEIVGVTVDGPDGVRDLKLSKRGTFITVYQGELGENPKVTVQFADGTTRLVNP